MGSRNNNNDGGPGGSSGGGRDLTATDRSARTVFVGNISYESAASELNEIFGKVGPVVHFRMVFDRDTGKPKGYGFCEYVDEHTADRAVRELNGLELHGRFLRVDGATSERRNKEEVRQLQMTLGAAQEESPYGASVDGGKAPDSIAQAVNSLPPEQMYELMKQMKLYIENNADEARLMLLQNPQLAYALLQAEVTMGVIDPGLATSWLCRDPIHTDVPPIKSQDPTHHGPPMGRFPSAVLRPSSSRKKGGPMDDPKRFFGRDNEPPWSRPGTSGAGGEGTLANNNPSQSSQSSADDKDNNPLDDEKAQLIVQVLQLSEEQINALPAEQKESVLQLRRQLKETAQQ